MMRRLTSNGWGYEASRGRTMGTIRPAGLALAGVAGLLLSAAAAPLATAQEAGQNAVTAREVTTYPPTLRSLAFDWLIEGKATRSGAKGCCCFGCRTRSFRPRT